jgi:DNA-binding CsgD family transcriptional regulator
MWAWKDEPDPNLLPAIGVLLGLIFTLGVLDLAVDVGLRNRFHLILEVVFLLLCLVSALVLGSGLLRTRGKLGRIRSAMAAREEERDKFRDQAQKLLVGLGEAIDTQLREWNLTAAERETALFLLKGYSHKEIANLTDKSERTVRQHSVVVYRKSGLAGRAELAAFFLEDLLLPMEASSREG